MTIRDLDPKIVEEIRQNNERVVALMDHQKYEFGIRSTKLYVMFNCLGRITVLDNGQIFHSLAGSRPCWNQEEWEEFRRLKWEEAFATEDINFCPGGYE